MNPVYCVLWEESERGWGTRPDGYTLHLTLEDWKAFEREYWDRMPKEVPDEYSRPCSDPYVAVVDDEDAMARLRQSKNGIWCRGKIPPRYSLLTF